MVDRLAAMGVAPPLQDSVAECLPGIAEPSQGRRLAMLLRGNAWHLPPARRLAQAIGACGVEVDFYFTSSGGPTSQSAEGVRYLRIDFDWRRPASRVRRVIREWAWGWTFVRRATCRRYDAFLTHNAGALPWIAIAAAQAASPWIYHAHEYGGSDARGIARAYGYAERVFARRASLVICPEPHRAALMHRHLRLRETPLVMRNAMPRRAPDDDGSLRTFVRERGGQGLRIVLYQGGIALTPEFEALVRSVPLWKRPDDLVLLGWSAPQARLAIERLAGAVGVAHRVHLHDPVPHARLWRLVSGAAIGLVLYGNRNDNERYAAPNKLGEYLMAGLAIVYTPCDGLTSLLDGKGFATKVDGQGPNGFARALDRYSSDEALLAARLGARLYAESEYNFENASSTALARIVHLLNAT